MKKHAYMANRLRELFLDGRWIANTNFKDQLEQLDWKLATTKVQDFNTIAALTFHINYYIKGLICAFETGELNISDQYSFDFKPIEQTEDWKQMVHEFLTNAARFADLVEQMDELAFDAPFVHEKYGSNMRNIEAMIEHGYYHLGQIVLIKKMAITALKKKNL